MSSHNPDLTTRNQEPEQLRPVLLIAANFVREQRWALITLMLYVIVFGAGLALSGGQSEEDTLFLLRSTSMYGLAFAGLLSASAVHNERRSRRILAVLSKGIERGTYLGGLLAGTMLASGVFCATIFAVGFLATRKALELAPFALMLMLLYLLAATAAMMFSTIFHPLLATAAAGLLLTAEAFAAHSLGGAWEAVLPSWTLVDHATSYGIRGWTMPWTACVSAWVHAVIFWGIATKVFERRDIAVAIE